MSRPEPGAGPARVHVGKLLNSISEIPGWGTWIRTKDARVRAGSFTAKLSPIGCGRAHYHAHPALAREPAGSAQYANMTVEGGTHLQRQGLHFHPQGTDVARLRGAQQGS